MVLRFHHRFLSGLFQDSARCHLDQRENRCGDDYVPLFATRNCAVVSDYSLKTPIAHLSLIAQFTESTSSSRN
jgi:hypothetical protein